MMKYKIIEEGITVENDKNPSILKFSQTAKMVTLEIEDESENEEEIVEK